MARVVVAPRELVDSVYRCARVSGVDSGVASLLGRETEFSVTQLGSGLERVVKLLSSGESPPVVMTALARFEITILRSGHSRLDLEHDLVVSDLALQCHDLGLRDVVVSMALADQTLLAPSEWLTAENADRGVIALVGEMGEYDPALVERIEARSRAALKGGLELDGELWEELSALAARYLVEESVIDQSEET